MHFPRLNKIRNENKFNLLFQQVLRFFFRSNPSAFRFSIVHRVQEVRERLDDIAQDVAQFHLISAQLNVDEEQSFVSVSRDRMTHSFVKASDVIGRDSDRAQIIDLLLRQGGKYRVSDSNNLSVIPIVGIGGLGKTTLAKEVYNDDKVGATFDLKLWVYVSFDFSLARLAKEILMAIGMERDLSNKSLDQLQMSLRRGLERRKFLLVLDDVWNEDRDKWLQLREFLSLGAEGSKVIVTTRSTSVSSIMTRAPPHLLKGLSKGDSQSLFFKCAFGDEKLAEKYPRLKNIGEEIVQKCGGVPVALKALGSLLYSKVEMEWIRVRDNEIWELEREDDHTIPALRLSYNTMSPCLKQCFAYCSTFPDDTLLFNMQLISIWMALGILQSPNGKMELEDIGEVQLEELCARSFLQQEDREFAEDILMVENFRVYNMHDLVHDLARSVTDSECSIVKSDDAYICGSVRHLRIVLNQNSLILIKKLKKLRSLHIEQTSDYEILKSFLATCTAQLRNLTVLDLSESTFAVLPSSIGSFKHLRYLNLSGNEKIKRLPNSICDLQSLQTMTLSGCNELNALPRGIRKLVSLRTLAVTTKQKYFPENGIGHLKSLRTLIIFRCKNLRSLPHDITYCTTLRTLCLGACKQLDFVSKSDERVTKLNIQTLAIIYLPRIKALPGWLKGASRTLKHLLISTCNNLVALPEWLPNIISLQTLRITKCEELSALPDGMEHLASLENLYISDCDRLELACTHGNDFRLSLQRVRIDSLPETTALPKWLQGAWSTLTVLQIRNCPQLAELPEWLPNFSVLKKLEIMSCVELVALPKGMHNLTSLIDLEMDNCEQLELASESIEDIVRLSLENLCISRLPQTTSLPKWLQGAAHSLQNLQIKDCPKLVALPEWLPNLLTLRKLLIKSCLELSSLPEGMSRLTSLTHLEIESPSSAFYERYQPQAGQDWASISHIPNIRIGQPVESKTIMPMESLITNQ